MKNQHVKGVSFVVAAALALASCKSTDWSKVQHEVTPNPLEMHADSVAVTIKVTVPVKIYKPKNTVIFTPTLKYNGGEKALKAVTFEGEKVKVKDPAAVAVVKKAEGTTYTYNDVIAYTPELKVSEVVAKVEVKKKTKVKASYTSPKIADATIVTPLLVQLDEKTLMGKEAMPRVVPMSNASDMLFTINQSSIVAKEASQDDMKAMFKFIKDSKIEITDPKTKKVVETKPNYDIKGVDISAYASPDGVESKNATLASDRANSTEKHIMAELKKMKMDAGIDAATFFTKTSTPEDWEGFRALMEKSEKIQNPDRDMIIRILQSQSDLEKREQEIKNISKVYTEIADEILPKLRRSMMTVKAEKKCKTDAELTAMSASTPDSLTAEELMYSADLAQDMNTKLAVYNNLARVYPNDWRGPNNIGCIYVMQNKLGDAETQFNKANGLSANNPAVLNNLGVVAIKKGDRKAAEDFYKKAGSSKETNYNMANLYIRQAKYSEAVSNYGSENSFNSALAKLLNKDFDAAISTIDASKDKDSAWGAYLKAVACARKADAAGVANNLKSAFAKDASLKKLAQEDMEFVKVKENGDVKNVLN